MFRTIFSIVVLVALSACVDSRYTQEAEFAQVQRVFGVSLKPNVHPNDPTKSSVQVKSKSQGWKKSGKKEGYVGFDEGESGWIFFGVKNEDMGDTCPVDGGNAGWVISKISLSDSGDAGDEKGDNFGVSQDAWLQKAFPQVTLSNGVIYDESAPGASPGQTFAGIFNANATDDEVEVYYEVELRDCSDGSGKTRLKTDPMVGNGGRK